MRPALRRSVYWLTIVLLPLVMALTAAGCGCGRRREAQGTISQLRQVRLMTAPDSKNRRCYLVAEVENAGAKPVRRAKVAASLVSARGKLVGVNYYFLENMKPGERRTFSMTVEAHGSFRDVRLSFLSPDAR